MDTLKKLIYKSFFKKNLQKKKTNFLNNFLYFT